jgi:hypothetical protein
MRIADRGVVHTFALTVFLAWISLVATASGEEIEACRVVNAQGSAFLKHCGDRLLSFALSLDDVRRMVTNGEYGKFDFECPIPAMCANEPEINGWFIDHKGWRRSAQDESAVFEVLRMPPVMAIAGRAGTPPPQPKSLCGVTEVRVADLPGRAVCYQLPETRSSSVIVIAADADAGFILVFQQRGLDWAALRDKTLQTLPRFEIERAAADAAMLRWVK